MDRGVIVIAVGKPTYGRLAYNLGQSIRHKHRDLPITLVYEKDTLRDLDNKQKSIFTTLQPIDPDIAYLDRRLMPFRIKLQLNKLATYDHTIYFDADGIILPNANLNKLFDETSIYDVQMCVLEKIPVTREGAIFNWGDLSTGRKALGINKEMLYLGSNFISIRRGHVRDMYFAKALEIHDRCFNKEINLGNLNYRGTLADEPIFTFTTGLFDLKMITPYSPVWNGNQPSPKHGERMLEAYTYLTIPGNGVNGYWENYYNRIVMEQGRLNGVFQPFLWNNRKF